MIQAIPFGRHHRRVCLGPEASQRLLLPSLLVFILVTALTRGCGLPTLPPLLTEPGIAGSIAWGIPRLEPPPLPHPGEPEFPVQATGDYTDIPWFVNGDLLLGRAEVQTDSFRGEARNHYCLGRPAASQRQAVRLTGKTTSQVTAGARRRLTLKKTDIITIISFNSIFTQKNQKS